MTSKSTDLFIGGQKISFPFKPYPSQILVMGGVVKALQQQTNALLESPTGSGKSLALLCSALAWQRSRRMELIADYHHKVAAAMAKSAGPPLAKASSSGDGVHAQARDDSGERSAPVMPTLFDVSLGGKAAHAMEGERDQWAESAASAVFGGGEGAASCQGDGEDEDLDDFFFDRLKYRKGSKGKGKGTRSGTASGKGIGKGKRDGDASNSSSAAVGSDTKKPQTLPDPPPTDEGPAAPLRPSKPPQIVFATRTHKQIGQIVHELARTQYSSATMTILSSREGTCLHPSISKHPNKTDECNNLRRHGGCPWTQQVSAAARSGRLRNCTWDIEDLVKVAKRHHACAYYTAREMIESADIVFCAYNYVLDEIVKSNTGLDFKGSVIIFDEAHNIEDVARSSASLTVELESLKRSIDGITELLTKNDKHPSEPHLQTLLNFFRSLSRWCSKSLEGPKAVSERFEQTCREFAVDEAVDVLRQYGIGPGTSSAIEAALKSISEEEMQAEQTAKQANRPPPVWLKAPGEAMRLAEHLALVLSRYFLTVEAKKNYRVVIQSTSKRVPVSAQSTLRGGGGKGGAYRQQYVKQQVVEMHFWCMTPAVVFKPLADVTHSIVLTSGTLSPMQSFMSELGAPFPITVEAQHVIPKKNVWVTCLSHGVFGHKLCSTFKSSTTFEFQDELGSTIIEASKRVPSGILVFFPSYSMMDRVVQRWTSTGLLDELKKHKTVFLEPRDNIKGKLEKMISRFDSSAASAPGALLLAVCRGKVSEGIDFADYRARLVITVGIPYPNFVDKQVQLKRAFNDRHRDRGLLSGAEWYDIQAFRALNQALGRCIRHRSDWGGIMLIDSRFSQRQQYTDSLSKWVRKMVHHRMGNADTFASLKQFCDTMQNGDDEASVAVFPTPSSTSASTLPHLPALEDVKPTTSAATEAGKGTEMSKRRLPSTVLAGAHATTPPPPSVWSYLISTAARDTAQRLGRATSEAGGSALSVKQAKAKTEPTVPARTLSEEESKHVLQSLLKPRSVTPTNTTPQHKATSKRATSIIGDGATLSAKRSCATPTEFTVTTPVMFPPSTSTPSALSSTTTPDVSIETTIAHAAPVFAVESSAKHREVGHPKVTVEYDVASSCCGEGATATATSTSTITPSSCACQPTPSTPSAASPIAPTTRTSTRFTNQQLRRQTSSTRSSQRTSSTPSSQQETPRIISTPLGVMVIDEPHNDKATSAGNNSDSDADSLIGLVEWEEAQLGLTPANRLSNTSPELV
eukprot:m.298016 g.298016  ORF g.298016 m.298016 type:complete len:1256 (+) comp15859_c1_seq3:20-3787(+)